ncbi:MAG: Hsp20/alpha crystallin family protein [Spirochaetaceae bacterium]|nr:MAG: Hsp20/alpha crystallin family protein [Spirochaetaceae bacterium]
MALVRWYDRDLEPTSTFDWLQRQINELFDFPRIPESRGLFDRRVSPAIDVIEHADRFTVECDLPGISQKDIDISIASGVLTIKGEKKVEKQSENTKVYRKETWEGSFQRTLSLPTGVDSDKVEATFNNGVLKISLPKREEAKTKRIELKTK